MKRLSLREVFGSRKRLEIRFYTSSLEKFLQARYVFEQSGLQLGHYLSSQDPYEEHYELGKEELLQMAIDEIKRRLKVNSLFFVEDTTVRIESLSSAEEDYPGLRVKEWFAETSFQDLDKELRARENDRRATVTSDIALHVPGLSRPVFLRGSTSGQVADTPPRPRKDVRHPWLSTETFNGWFIPEGGGKPLGMMLYEESLAVDFRVRSLAGLVDRLEEYTAVLNLTSSYLTRRPRSEVESLNLFPQAGPLLLIVGKVCAGKTTMGQHLAGRYGHKFIEASDVVRMIAKRNSITAPTPLYLAKDLLERKGRDIVAREIAGTHGDEIASGAVIAGFRTIEEVEFIRSRYQDCKVVLVEASERTRFERHLRRKRLEGISTLAVFRDHDRAQWEFGLLRVAKDLADISIENEGELEDYFAQGEAVVEGDYEGTPGVSTARVGGESVEASRIFRCLEALASLESPATCAEIAAAVKTEEEDGGRQEEATTLISPRHVNWVLKDYPELARRIDAMGDRIRYELLPAGRSYLRAVRSLGGSGSGD